MGRASVVLLGLFMGTASPLAMHGLAGRQRAALLPKLGVRPARSALPAVVAMADLSGQPVDPAPEAGGSRPSWVPKWVPPADELQKLVSPRLPSGARMPQHPTHTSPSAPPHASPFGRRCPSALLQVPLAMMFFCILFNYTILRDTKDVLVVTAKQSSAEARASPPRLTRNRLARPCPHSAPAHTHAPIRPTRALCGADRPGLLWRRKLRASGAPNIAPSPPLHPSPPRLLASPR
jgi:hypothetical protein